MQRLSDIVQSDLEQIMNVFMDFTQEVIIQCGSIKKTLNASLQSDVIQMTSDVSPLNAYTLSLYYIEPNDAEFNNCMKKNAIIFVDGVSFRIVDSILVKGLRTLSLERHGGR